MTTTPRQATALAPEMIADRQAWMPLRDESGPLVRAVSLRKVFRSGAANVIALAGVDFAVAQGEMVALVGPSGSGKSTLLHLLAGLDTPTSGTVYFAGNRLDAFGERELESFRSHAVGFIWQRHQLLTDFTALENVAMPLLIRGIGVERAMSSARAWLDEVGLSGRAEHRASELSGGEQQRVAIARALATRPRLLLADEPTGDLDEQNTESIFELISRLHRSHHLTSILATHNLFLAQRTDRVLTLEHGLLVKDDGTTLSRRVSGRSEAKTSSKLEGRG